MAIDEPPAQAEEAAKVSARSEYAIDKLQAQAKEVAEVAARSEMAIDRLLVAASTVWGSARSGGRKCGADVNPYPASLWRRHR